jgi:hypothetical protein
MRSYLEIALRVASSSQPMPCEPKPACGASTERVVNQSRPAPPGIVTVPQTAPDELAACGSSDCGGCYHVGNGKRIHPPKCGEDYKRWLERWEPKAKVQ